jgi:outer membrane protein assembly factor BamB
VNRWLVVGFAALALAADWPGFLGPNNDQTSPERGVRWPPRHLWTLPAGEGYTGPAIVGKRLYLFDRIGGQARVRCLDADSRAEVWTFQYPTDYTDKYGFDGGPRTSPVVAGGRVFVYGPEGMLVALDSVTGRELWRVDTAARYHVIQNFFGVGSTPCVEGDRVIVAVGGSPPGPEPDDFRQIKPDGSALVAFDAATGKELWKCGADLAAYSSPFIVDAAGGRRGYYFARGGLLAFDPTAGRVTASFPWRATLLESVNSANPVHRGDEVFISETYGPGCAVLKAGPFGFTPVWSDRGRDRDGVLRSHWARPVLIGDHLYGCHGRHSSNAELRCVEWKTGKICWRVPGLARTTMTGIDGHLLVLSEYGLLAYLKANPDKYEEVGRIDLGARGENRLKHPSWAAPVVADGRLYLRGKDELACLELIPPQP